MHALQPKHIKMSSGELDNLLKELNIAVSQIPKIKLIDPCTPDGCETGDVVKIERNSNGRKTIYYRVVV